MVSRLLFLSLSSPCSCSDAFCLPCSPVSLWAAFALLLGLLLNLSSSRFVVTTCLPSSAPVLLTSSMAVACSPRHRISVKILPILLFPPSLLFFHGPHSFSGLHFCDVARPLHPRRKRVGSLPSSLTSGDVAGIVTGGACHVGKDDHLFQACCSASFLLLNFFTLP